MERGIAAVTIDEIVVGAGVAKGSFYRYFADKLDLVGTLMEPLSQAVQYAFVRCEKALRGAHTVEEVAGTYRDLAEDLAAGVLTNPQTVLLYLQEARAPGVGARQPVAELATSIDEGATLLSRVAREHGILRDINPEVSASAVVGMVEHILFRVLRGKDLGDPTRLAENLVDLVMHGVSRR